jgi:hypothetical protein
VKTLHTCYQMADPDTLATSPITMTEEAIVECNSHTVRVTHTKRPRR